MSVKSGRVTTDPIPGIVAAGRVIAMGDESAELCMKNDYNLQHLPGTPEHIRKYRKSF